MVSTRRMAQTEPEEKLTSKPDPKAKSVRTTTVSRPGSALETSKRSTKKTSGPRQPGAAGIQQGSNGSDKHYEDVSKLDEQKPVRSTRMKTVAHPPKGLVHSKVSRSQTSDENPGKDHMPSFGAPTQAQMAKRVRSTQLSKPLPLSPKKVTQVPKSYSRATAPKSDKKVPARTVPTKPIVKSKDHTQGRSGICEDVETVENTTAGEQESAANARGSTRMNPNELGDTDGRNVKKVSVRSLRQRNLDAGMSQKDIITSQAIHSPDLHITRRLHPESNITQDPTSHAQTLPKTDEEINLEELLVHEQGPNSVYLSDLSSTTPSRKFVADGSPSLQKDNLTKAASAERNTNDEQGISESETVGQEATPCIDSAFPGTRTPEICLNDGKPDHSMNELLSDHIESVRTEHPSSDDSAEGIVEKNSDFDASVSPIRSIGYAATVSFVERRPLSPSSSPSQRILDLGTFPNISRSQTPPVILGNKIKSTKSQAGRRRSFAVFESQTPPKGTKRPFTADGCSSQFVPSSTTTPVSTVNNDENDLSVDACGRTMDNEPLLISKGSQLLPRTPLIEQSPNRRMSHLAHGSSVAACGKLRTSPRATIHTGADAFQQSQRGSKTIQFTPVTPASVIPGSDEIPVESIDSPSLNSMDSIISPARNEENSLMLAAPVNQRRHDRHVATVGAITRFRTPQGMKSMPPLSVQKPATLRKGLSSAATPPVRVPVKFGDSLTPESVPMTPHPSAPLRGTVILVEVYTLEGASASTQFLTLLKRLGARTTKSWSEKITHVVFKDGSPTTLQRIRLWNKEAKGNGNEDLIQCVNTRWVCDCDANGLRMDEGDDLYIVNTEEIPRGGKRRRQSMEPGVLHSFGGNVIKDRKSSGSLSRTPRGFRSPVEKTPEPAGTPANIEEPFGVPYLVDGESSPDSPAWLHPFNLVQQTAPLNKVRKLKFTSIERRRLSYWPSHMNDES